MLQSLWKLRSLYCHIEPTNRRKRFVKSFQLMQQRFFLLVMTSAAATEQNDDAPTTGQREIWGVIVIACNGRPQNFQATMYALFSRDDCSSQQRNNAETGNVLVCCLNWCDAYNQDSASGWQPSHQGRILWCSLYHLSSPIWRVRCRHFALNHERRKQTLC